MGKLLTLELGKGTYKMLKEIAKAHDKTIIDIIREGIALRKLADDLEKEGKALAVVSGDNIEFIISIELEPEVSIELEPKVSVG